MKTGFRRYLQDELLDRCKKNQGYSLRAFARNLGVPASSLSLILNGSRPLTDKMRTKIGLALGISLKDIPREDSAVKYTKYQQIELAQFEIISDWYHMAILELIKVKDFRADAKWIAHCLDISIHEVHRAVENLVGLNLLTVFDNGTWVDRTESQLATNIRPGITSEAAKEMQRQVLDLAKKAINEVPLALRDHSTMTMAINKSNIDVAKKKIKKFRREMDALLSSSAHPDEVYQLSISFFPVTRGARGLK